MLRLGSPFPFVHPKPAMKAGIIQQTTTNPGFALAKVYKSGGNCIYVSIFGLFLLQQMASYMLMEDFQSTFNLPGSVRQQLIADRPAREKYEPSPPGFHYKKY